MKKVLGFISGIFLINVQAFAFIGGNLANRGEFPSTVMIQYGCTASVIATDKLLLAGHCIQIAKNNLDYKTGDVLRIYVTPKAVGETPLEATVKKVIVHPVWAGLVNSGLNFEEFALKPTTVDLAVIVLKQSIFSPKQVVKFNYQPLKREDEIIVGGYGCEDDGMPNRDPKYKTAFKKITTLSGNIAGVNQKNSRDSETSLGCEGDSGGPVYIIKNKQKYQVGVNSSVRGNEEKGKMNFLQIYRVQDWIKKVLK